MGAETINRECFESEFAGSILKNPQLFRAVKKLSVRIASILKNDQNRNAILTNQLVSEKVINEFYSDSHYGKLGDASQRNISAEKFLDIFIYSLENDTNLILILHMHHVFMQQLYEKLPVKLLSSQFSTKPINNPHTLSQKISILLSDAVEKWGELKKEMASLIFENELFLIPARFKYTKTEQCTDRIGIVSNNRKCSYMEKTEQHDSIENDFQPNLGSPWVRNVFSKGLNFRGGPSGHTGSALLLAIMLGNFELEDLKEYITANIGILTGGGFHDVHGILTVGQKIGIPYEEGQYIHFLPASCFQSASFKSLSEKYPEYLPLNLFCLPIQHTSWTNMYQEVKCAVSKKFTNIIDGSAVYAASVVKDCPSYSSNNFLDTKQNNRIEKEIVLVENRNSHSSRNALSPSSVSGKLLPPPSGMMGTMNSNGKA